VTPYAAGLLARVQQVYPEHADPVRAMATRAYMRDQFPYLGFSRPVQRRLSREVLSGSGKPTEADLVDLALGCWALDEREYQYFAMDVLRRYIGLCGADFIGTARTLITTRPWWDTVDELAAQVVGPLVARFPVLVKTMDAWIADADMWLVRTAILHQNGYKSATDADRLFAYCAAQAAHRDFFVRKAIGWALREYARTDPAAVRDFVAEHRAGLSGLSIREALKHL
jgi:3-methyladenine DNA glycosylase AlkD